MDKEKEKAARGVDSVTDYVEEKELGEDSNVKASLTKFGNDEVVQSVVISQQDIDLVAEECEISKPKAEELLKNKNGSIKEAILGYIHGA